MMHTNLKMTIATDILLIQSITIPGISKALFPSIMESPYKEPDKSSATGQFCAHYRRSARQGDIGAIKEDALQNFRREVLENWSPAGSSRS
jgi:hypothetical protein